MCPIVEAVPRSLDEHGHLKVGVEHFSDEYGWGVENTPMDEMRVVTPVRLAGSTFVGNTIDSNFWTTTSANGGTWLQSACQITLSTKTTSANGSIAIQSVANARYTGGSCNRYRAQIRLGDTGATNNARRWGMFNSTDGAYFKLNGTTLYACTRKNNIETAVASTSWNGNRTVPTLTDVQAYEIYITNAKVYFSIAGILRHTASFSTTTWTNTTNLPVRADNTNSSGLSTNHTIDIRVATIYRLGQELTSPRYKYIGSNSTNVLKQNSGRLHAVVNTNNAGTITVYDNTAGSGTQIAVIDATKVLGTITFNVSFFVGLTVVTASGALCTVIYE